MSAYSQQGSQTYNSAAPDQPQWHAQQYDPSYGQWSGYATAYDQAGYGQPDMYGSQPPLPPQAPQQGAYVQPQAYGSQGQATQAGYTNNANAYPSSSLPLLQGGYGSLYAPDQQYSQPPAYNTAYTSTPNPPLPLDSYPSPDAPAPGAAQPQQPQQAYQQVSAASSVQSHPPPGQQYSPYHALQQPWSQPYQHAPAYNTNAAYQGSAAYPTTAAYPQAGYQGSAYSQGLDTSGAAYQAGAHAPGAHYPAVAAAYDPTAASFQSGNTSAEPPGYNAAYTYQPGAVPFPYPEQHQGQYQGHAGANSSQPGLGESSQVPPMPPETHTSTAEAKGNPYAQADGHSQEAAPLPALPPTDALDIFSGAGRAARPKAFAVIVRGIPGSGKSFIAAKLRKLEVDAGGPPPRVHSIDAYFMNEVERPCDAGPGRGKRTVKVEEYEYDAEMEAAYEDSLLKAFARTMAEGQHPVVIVDAPLLSAARLHDFRVAAQAAGFEVYVTQSPVQDPQECYKRNIHQRTFIDIQRSKALFEATPPSMSTLDITRVLDDGSPTTTPTLTKRKSLSQTESAAERSGAAPLPTSTSAGPPGPKRQKAEGGDDRDLLAAIDKGFMRMDEGEGGKSGAAAAASGVPKATTTKSRWEDSDDDDDDASAPATAAGNTGSKPSAADAKLHELMSAHAKVTKKTVRWPDQEPDDDIDAFRIGRPRQLETIHYLEGLGPQWDEGERPAILSFTQAARAEHDSERQKHIAGGWSLT